MSAVRALPNAVAVAREDQAALYISQQLAVTGFVLFFDFGHLLEQESDLGEALFASLLGKPCIHIGPLIIFTVGRIQKIRRRIWNCIAMQQLEPQFSMLFFIGCRFSKNVGNLYIAFFFGFRSIVRVFVTSFLFAGKSRFQILFRFCSFQVTHD